MEKIIIMAHILTLFQIQLFIFTDAQYRSYLETGLQTCNETFVLKEKLNNYTKTNVHKWDCADRCTNHPKCKFFFSNPEMSCVLYSSCNALNRVDTPGRTFVTSLKPFTHVPVRGTCDKESLLGTPFKDIENDMKCMQQCQKQKECRFTFYTVERWCYLFSSCNNFISTDQSGLIFEMGKFTEDDTNQIFCYSYNISFEPI